MTTAEGSAAFGGRPACRRGNCATLQGDPAAQGPAARCLRASGGRGRKRARAGSAGPCGSPDPRNPRGQRTGRTTAFSGPRSLPSRSSGAGQWGPRSTGDKLVAIAGGKAWKSEGHFQLYSSSTSFLCYAAGARDRPGRDAPGDAAAGRGREAHRGVVPGAGAGRRPRAGGLPW